MAKLLTKALVEVIPNINSYMLRFGNTPERHFWMKKIQKWRLTPTWETNFSDFELFFCPQMMLHVTPELWILSTIYIEGLNSFQFLDFFFKIRVKELNY